jgi:hypothetical protein
MVEDFPYCLYYFIIKLVILAITFFTIESQQNGLCFIKLKNKFLNILLFYNQYYC